jgi:putative ABC transport system substrate-binding protein
MQFNRLKRRDFVALLGGAATWPVTARAQQSGRLAHIGVLGPTLSNPPAIEQYQAFRTRLAEVGFQEGQNVTIDYRPVDGPRGPFIVALELVRSRPDLIVATGPETSSVQDL